MWAFTKDGAYSVKKAYMLGKGCDLDCFHRAWVDIWCMEASLKVRQLGWRMFTKTLPTRSLLVHCHLSKNMDYPWSGEVETCRHANFECCRVKELWEECGCAIMREELNLKVFEDKTMENEVLIARVKRLVEEHGRYNKKVCGA
ncbi:Regulatory protein RecX [Bienertia sinuspersici]